MKTVKYLMLFAVLASCSNNQQPAESIITPEIESKATEPAVFNSDLVNKYKEALAKLKSTNSSSEALNNDIIALESQYRMEISEIAHKAESEGLEEAAKVMKSKKEAGEKLNAEEIMKLSDEIVAKFVNRVNKNGTDSIMTLIFEDFKATIK